MQIPFSVPPYMSLLARSTATLEGIALMGDPGYQMVSQVSQPVVHKLADLLCKARSPDAAHCALQGAALMAGHNAGPVHPGFVCYMGPHNF